MQLASAIIWAVISLDPNVVATDQATPPNIPVPRATQPAVVVPSGNPIDSIAQAPDPSAAVAAYGNALATSPGSVHEIEVAFVRRMIDLGVPGLAEAQAKNLVQRDPSNGQAWSVLAYMSGQRGQTDAAMGQIETAVERSPDDPFVQRTAGQLLAWYDSAQPAPALPAPIARDLPVMREKVSHSDAYVSAYQAARDEYQRMGAAAGPGAGTPTAAATTASAPTPPDAFDDAIVSSISPVPSPGGYVYPQYDTGGGYLYGNYGTYQPYAYPAVYTPVYPAYYWDRPWWGGWWWGFGASVIIVNNKNKWCDNNWNHSNWGHGKGWGGSNNNWRGNWRGGNSNNFVGPREFDRSTGQLVRSGNPGRGSGAARGDSGFTGNSRGGNSSTFVGPMPFRRSNEVASRGSSQSRSNATRSSPSQGSTFVGPMPFRRSNAPAAASRGSSQSRFVGPVQPSSGRQSGVSSNRGGGSRGSPAARGGGGSRGGGGRGGGGGGRGGGGRGR